MLFRSIVGDGPPDGPSNKKEPERLNTGITVVGKRSVIPRGARLGRNVKVGGEVRATDWTKRVIPSGGTVERRPDGVSKKDFREEASR